MSVENLTVCNFLNGADGGGNQIWWDGGAATGTQSDLGDWDGELPDGNRLVLQGQQLSDGGLRHLHLEHHGTRPGLFKHDYASNMNDSAYYVGACPDCNVTLDDVHGENTPQGYSGTNSGGTS